MRDPIENLLFLMGYVTGALMNRSDFETLVTLLREGKIHRRCIELLHKKTGDLLKATQDPEVWNERRIE